MISFSALTNSSVRDSQGEWSVSISITGSQPRAVSIRRCIGGGIARSEPQ